jgi:hypothetical protein
MRYYLAALATVVALSSAALYADPVPYNNAGTVAPTVATYATGTSIDAYFYSVSAGDNDTISLYDLTTSTFLAPQTAFPNHSSNPGDEVTFTGSNAGDQIVFELNNSSYPDSVFASDPSLSTDGINHAYVTSFSGAIPGSSPSVTVSGTYVGMEDLPLGASDLDYNDDTFVFTQVASTPTPEPSSFILLGTGLLGIAGVVRRKFAL